LNWEGSLILEKIDSIMDSPETIIITGSTGNLGRAVTQKMVTLGYRVIGTKEPDDPFEFGSLKGVILRPLDLMDEQAVFDWVLRMGEKEENLAAGILLVGGFAMGNLKETSGEKLRRMLRLNFMTAYYMVRPLVEVFKKQGRGGHIILIGARPALQPEDGQEVISYALSKSLLIRLAEIINASEKKHRIRASVIVPSIIDTPANRAAMPDADPEAWVPPDRIAEAIAYLLSDSGKMLREPIFMIYNRS
jgi:NAD(P)-dependent dehydrogenase (short-subunit alcohol dehydrogenase family)